MKNRAVRIALFLLVALAFAGAAFELSLLDRQATTLADAGRAFERKARQVETSLQELRAAQYAYVAAGQTSTFWTGRAGTLLTSLAADLRQLDALEKGAVAAGLTLTEPATALLADDFAALQRIDSNVQRYVGDDQRLLASDVVFGDLREADQALSVHVEEARQRVAAAGLAAAEPLRRKQAATAAGAALFALIVLLLLVPSVRLAPTATTVAAPPANAETRKTEDRAPAPATRDQGPGTTTVPAVSVDLAGTASLCTDFGKVHDASQLPVLLERVAALLDASGVIVWMADSARGELRPVASHGYAAETLAHIRAVRVGDDNATAEAYRDRALRVVAENALSNGAIAAPLLVADGCVGVVAAEIRHGGERRPDLQAALTILAAQLATLAAPVSPPSSPRSLRRPLPRTEFRIDDSEFRSVVGDILTFDFRQG